MPICQDMFIKGKEFFGKGFDGVPFFSGEGTSLWEEMSIADLTLSFGWVMLPILQAEI